MQEWGKVRSRTRNGRTTFWIDVRPLARIWTTPAGAPFADRAHAEAVLSDVRRMVWKDGKTREAAVAYFLSRSNPRMRLGYAFRLWVERMREAQERGHYSRSYVDHLAHYGTLLGALADQHYQSVTYAQLEDLDGALAARPLSPKTRSHVFGALHTFFRWMRRRGMVDAVPEFPVVTVPESDWTPLEPEQQRAVLDAIAPDRRAIFLALAFHGLRPSEAARLNTPGDYDWREGVVRLPASKAKTRRAALVPLGSELRGLLEAHLGAEQRIDGGPLFRNPRAFRADKRWTLDSLRDAWMTACRVVGVECSLYRGTKHSSATAALRRGVPLDQIQAALRHADIRSTVKYARAADLVPVEKLRPA